jgi:hypothetical protein
MASLFSTSDEEFTVLDYKKKKILVKKLDPDTLLEQELEKETEELNSSIVVVKNIQASLYQTLLGQKPQLRLIEENTAEVNETIDVAGQELKEATQLIEQGSSYKLVGTCAAVCTLIGGPIGFIVSTTIAGTILGSVTGCAVGVGIGKGVFNLFFN